VGGKWKAMLVEQPAGTKMPEVWRMAALMKMCPKEIKSMIDINWDTIQERYEVMREKVVVWATNALEKQGGAVPMDTGGVDGDWDGGGWEEEWQEGKDEVAPVYPNTRCYHCQGYGHMARECPQKGKGKGGEKGKERVKERRLAKEKGKRKAREVSREFARMVLEVTARAAWQAREGVKVLGTRELVGGVGRWGTRR